MQHTLEDDLRKSLDKAEKQRGNRNDMRRLHRHLNDTYPGAIRTNEFTTVTGEYMSSVLTGVKYPVEVIEVENFGGVVMTENEKIDDGVYVRWHQKFYTEGPAYVVLKKVVTISSKAFKHDTKDVSEQIYILSSRFKKNE